jgi:hypothetical protein
MPHTPSSVSKTGGEASRRRLVIVLYQCRLQRPLKGYLPMSKILSREDVHSELLLALAGYWRKCAAQSDEAWRSDMMSDTAKEFERAAAKATSQTPATLSPYDSSSSRRGAQKRH